MDGTDRFYEQLLAQGYTKEQISALLADYAGMEGIIDDEMSLAQGMEQAQPMGQMVGDRYVAPNAMQHIGAGMSTFAAQKMQRDAMKDKKELAEKKQEALIQELRRGASQQQSGGLPWMK